MRSFSFGLFADCQYANKRKAGRRYYKKSGKKLRDCIDVFNKSNLEFVVNLGDLIDEGFNNFHKPLEIISRLDVKVYHLVGNHDYTVDDDEKERILDILHITRPYSSFTVERWRFVIVDGTEISTYRYPTSRTEFTTSRAYHLKRAPDSADWNGAMGEAQLDWLASTLAEAQVAEENVVIFSHFPVYPKNPHNLWNAEDLSFIQDYDCVKAFISGHDHGGNYAIRDGKHYLCIRGMVETRHHNAFCIVDVHDDRLFVRGFGREEGRILGLSKRSLP